MKLKPIYTAYNKVGLRHVILRGIEFPLLQTKFTSNIYWKVAPLYYDWRFSRDLKEYDRSLCAFDLRYVNPNQINRLTPRGKPSDGVLNDIGSVFDGQWDLQSITPDNYSLFYDEKPEDTLLYQAMKSRYQYGKNWENTEFYQTVLNIINDGGSEWHGCSSVKDLEEKCEYVDQLYKKIRDEGYQTQMELRDIKPSLNEPFGYMNAYLMEIAVDITRDGELLLVDGRHRLYLSQILNIDKIPVTIIVRHENWLEKINRSGKQESELLD